MPEPLSPIDALMTTYLPQSLDGLLALVDALLIDDPTMSGADLRDELLRLTNTVHMYQPGVTGR